MVAFGLPELLGGICPPSVSRSEVASFVREDGGDRLVFMRSRVDSTSHGEIRSDGRTVEGLPESVVFSIESSLEDGTRIRLQGRFSGDSVEVSALDHENPL